MNNQQQKYSKELSKMSNLECIHEWCYYVGGDDYDGFLTSEGEMKLPMVNKELNKRLIASGFLKEGDEL